MNKREIAVFALLSAVLILSACNSNKQNDNQTPTVTLSGMSAEHNPNQAVTSPSASDGQSEAPTVTPAYTFEIKEPEVTAGQVVELFQDVNTELEVSEGLFEWCVEVTGNENFLKQINEQLSDGSYSDEKWYELTGMTVKVTNDLYSGKAYEDNNIYVMESNGESGIQLTFGGDISFADNFHVMEYYKTTENGITDCISPFLIDRMKAADISMLNNEFCFSENGEPMPNKMWTFRGKPSNVAIYDELGTDIVDLANNHIYDYGEQAFLDTLDTLNGAEIQYVGAGKDIEEASRPIYYIIEGKKIAYVAATRAEKFILTPEATETSPGVLRCYDPAAFIEVIKEAKNNADIVIANVHWGAEDSHYLEEVQPETAYQYIDAGADLIIGTHVHCLQGIEFYKGVPIIYNLGNFWFDMYDVDTGLLEVTINDDNSMDLLFHPAVQSGRRTTYVGGEEDAERIFDFLREFSINAGINENGVITEIKD